MKNSSFEKIYSKMNENDENIVWSKEKKDAFENMLSDFEKTASTTDFRDADADDDLYELYHWITDMFFNMDAAKERYRRNLRKR